MLKLNQIFWPIAYVLGPLIPILLYAYDRPGDVGSGRGIGIICGTIAFTWFLNQLIIAARPKSVEKGFGLDRMYRVHTQIAVAAVVLAVIHKTLFNGGWAFGPAPDWLSLNLFILVTLVSLIYMGHSVLLKFEPIAKLRTGEDGKPRISYQNIKLFHNLSVLAVIIVFFHIRGTSEVNGNVSLDAYFTIYLILALAFYVYHKFIRSILLNKDPYTIRRVTADSTNIVSLDLVNAQNHRMVYKPGQFVFLSAQSSAVDREQHPFSISSSPGHDRSFRLTIKDLGDYTSKIGAVQQGDTATIEGPYGNFTHTDLPSGTPLVFIAGGVGITPMISMLGHLSRHQPDTTVDLLWCARYRDDLIRYDEVQNISTAMKNLTVTPILSRDEEWEGEKGRISRGHLEPLVTGPQSDPEIHFFICGPHQLMMDVIEHLKDMSVGSDRIHFEDFAF